MFNILKHSVHFEWTSSSPEPSIALKNLKPYDPSSSLEKILSKKEENPLKLDWNEATIRPSPKVIEAIINFFGNNHHINWYPPLKDNKLLSLLSQYTALPEKNLLITNGSDDALDLVCKTFIDQGDNVLVPFPTYTHFIVFAKSRGGIINLIHFDSPLTKEINEILKYLSPEVRLLYLVSPNNPTGIVYTPDEIEEILITSPKTLILLDEAYFEFCKISSIDLINKYKNLVVTRTFSKFYGIAGLRIGYLATNNRIMEHLKKVFNPKSVNSIAKIAASAALEDKSYYENYLQEIEKSKKFLAAELPKRGFYPVITPANFILFKVQNPKEFISNLESLGVYVRDRSNIQGLEGYIRMNAGTLEQMQEFIKRLDILLKKD